MMENKPKLKKELQEDFVKHCKVLATYWSKQEGTQLENMEGFLHSLFVTFDGCSGGFPCAIDLVLRPHPEDKDYCIANGEDWVEDGLVLNDDVSLHNLLWSV